MSVTSFSSLSFESTVCKLCILVDWASHKDHVTPILNSCLHNIYIALEPLIIKVYIFKLKRLGVAPLNLP